MNHSVVWLETSQRFEVEPEEAVLAAALRAGIALPHECQFGGCGACRVKLIEGSVTYGDELPMGLGEEEAQAGYALACQARPTTDLVISVQAPAGSQAVRCQATVQAVSALGPDVLRLRLRLRLPEDAVFNFRPGQYMNVMLGDGRHRSFSMASKPDGHAVDFHVKRIPGGFFTEQILSQLCEGHALDVELPLGNFNFHAADYRPLVMVATGTGLAPIKSMLEALMDDDCPPVSLYWGVRHEADLYLHEEIQRWAERLYEFQYVPVLSRAADHWNGRRGHVQDAVLADHPDLSEHAIYICGSPNMVHDAKTAFAAHGASMDHLYAESFVFQAA